MYEKTILLYLIVIHRLEYFGVQFYGECWSGPDAGETFARDGTSEDCYEGVGKRKTNAVYRIEDLPGKPKISWRIFPYRR